MMWLVRLLIDPGGDLVLSQMHEALDHVLDEFSSFWSKRFRNPKVSKKTMVLGTNHCWVLFQRSSLLHRM